MSSKSDVFVAGWGVGSGVDDAGGEGHEQEGGALLLAEASPPQHPPPLLEHHVLAEPHGAELQGHLPRLLPALLLLSLGLLLRLLLVRAAALVRVQAERLPPLLPVPDPARVAQRLRQIGADQPETRTDRGPSARLGFRGTRSGLTIGPQGPPRHSGVLVVWHSVQALGSPAAGRPSGSRDPLPCCDREKRNPIQSGNHHSDHGSSKETTDRSSPSPPRSPSAAPGSADLPPGRYNTSPTPTSRSPGAPRLLLLAADREVGAVLCCADLAARGRGGGAGAGD
jgi:hypothetical protein